MIINLHEHSTGLFNEEATNSIELEKTTKQWASSSRSILDRRRGIQS